MTGSRITGRPLFIASWIARDPATATAPANTRHIGVNFRGFLQTFDGDRIERFAAAAGLPIRGYSTDVELDRNVLVDLSERGHVPEPAGYDYRELAQVIANSDALTLTDRYHGLAYSLLAAVPCVSVVSYGNADVVSYKTRGLVELTGLDLPVLDSLDEKPDEVLERARSISRRSLVEATERLRVLALDGLETLRAFLETAL